MKFSHPIPFLLYLEWFLLALIGFMELFPNPIPTLPRVTWFNLLGLLIFGVMGLKLPMGYQLFVPYIYVVLEFILILILSLWGNILLFSILYIILIMRSSVVFSNKERLLILGISLILYLPSQFYRFYNLDFSILLTIDGRYQFLVLIITLVMLILFFLSSLINTILAQKKTSDQLALANDKIREYALKIEEIATLSERNRIAREIHDSLGHSLTALNLQMEAAVKLWSAKPHKAIEFLHEAQKLGLIALSEVRQSVSSLRSHPLEHKSLEEAMNRLVDDFRAMTNIIPECNWQIDDTIGVDIQLALYRILQESLTNICKYAEASSVTISLVCDLNIELVIADDGVGFDVNQNTTGFGLQGMNERCLALGGYFKIISAKTAGCTIIATFPHQRNVTNSSALEG